MMDAVDEQTGLVMALYAAAANGDWQGLLDRLAGVTQADRAAMLLTPVRGAALRLGVGVPDDLLDRLRFDRVYDADGLPGGQAVDGLLRLVRVRARSGAQAVLSVHRDAHRQDFRSADGQRLSALAPFLAQAADLWIETQARKAAAEREAAAASAFGAGWIVFDLSGTVIQMSDFAQAWGEGLSLRLADRRRLELPEAEAAQAFRAAFAAAVEGRATGPVLIAGEPPAEIVLALTVFAGEAAILARLRQMPMAGAAPAERFARHFGLSLSEARLAALISDGHSLREAAKTLGWTEESTRTCSKAIFARMGVSGQPGLVRRVATSALWLGQVG